MTIILSNRKYPDSFAKLEKVGVPLISEERAKAQDIRPLRIGFINLMPTASMKDTEEQYFDLIGSTSLQIIPELVTFDTFVSSTERKEHLDAFYRTFSEVKAEGLDGLIMTGANLEQPAFEEVKYWEELKLILDWAREHVPSTLYSCWSMHAAMKHFYGLERETYTHEDGSARKIMGLFEHALPNHLVSPLTRGLPEVVLCPHAHWKGVSRDAVSKIPELTILCDSDEAGILLMEGRGGRDVYLQGHPEYAADTLKKEYLRDKAPEKFGAASEFPLHYFTHDDETTNPKNTWRATGTVLFHNWINHVYQTTHFELGKGVMSSQK